MSFILKEEVASKPNFHWILNKDLGKSQFLLLDLKGGGKQNAICLKGGGIHQTKMSLDLKQGARFHF